ncbi:MAG: InlB B-repeat-containing protein, partial [Candidatus Methanomethylophilaceae archaeon]|nr:InlB B-repeat-containing protein [Candidatus Methanomethylophilaceae archaeon]
VWETIDYTITYDLGDGINNVGNPESYTIEDETFNILDPTREGYTFTGWFESNLTTPADTTIEQGTIGNLEFYAKWTANINNLIFNSNTGAGSMENMEIATDATVALNANGFTRDGYTFAGWATSASGEIAYADEASYTMGTGAEYTLYAIWEAIDYTITYNLDSGENNVGNPESYTIEDETFNILDPTREGYTFTGWFESNLTTPADTTIASGSTGDRAFYAVWEANINDLIFDANGGEGSMDAMQIATDATVALNVNGFTRTGYTFAGWATSVSGEIAYADEASYTMGVDSEYTLYALWNIVVYDIDYIMANGNNHLDNPLSYTCEDESITILSPTRAGYTFTGWYDSDLVTPANTTIASGSTGDRAFYAVWEANINDLIFDANTGAGTMVNMEIATDSTETLNTNLFTRTGYTFAGWATTPSGEVVYANEANYTMGTGAEYTLYAVWEANKYTVTFDKQEGVFGSDNIEVTYDVSMPEAAGPSRAGYTFAGYYTEITGGGTQYYTENMNSTRNWDITENTTLYAKWIPNIYTVTFNVNGGNEIEFASKQVTFDTQIGELPEVGKIGYSFVEWNSQENGLGVTYNEEMLYQVASNITLYAKWSINQYTITFNSNGGTSVTAITQDYNSVVSEPSEPTKTNFLFAGWYADAGITEFYVFDRIPAEDITLYADWGTMGLGFILINGDTEYAVYKGTLEEGSPMAIRIPRRYNDKYVTSLGGEWDSSLSKSFSNIFITSIYIPSSITVLNDYVFTGNNSMDTITLPDSITKIGMHAFSFSGLNSITIPGSVTEIGDYAFQLCYISSVTFNEGLEKIGRGAFTQCNRLTSIELPSTLTHLGGFYASFDDSVFADCVALESVTINAVTPPTLSGETTMVFKGCGSLTNIYVPLQSVDTYKMALGWSTYASKISAITE